MLSPAFTRYDPGYILGREVHGATLGIIGLGRIGKQIAKRARGFEMTVLYHNRRRDERPSVRWACDMQRSASFWPRRTT